MNFWKYAFEYTRFHGCFTYRHRDLMIILDFVDRPWSHLAMPRLFEADSIRWTRHPPFLQALKIYFKTEVPCSVFCKRDSWSVLLGNERIVYPMPGDKATFQLYATPYFVESPRIVDDHLKLQSSAHEHFYNYKNCIVYLDPFDIPKPGECYMSQDATLPFQKFYRICFLSNESESYMVDIASEWKNIPQVKELSFVVGETVVLPKCISFEPTDDSEYPESTVARHGNVNKSNSTRRPERFLRDVLCSYQRYLGGSEPVKDVGLVLDWPLTVSYEGTIRRCNDNSSRTKVVMLAVNGRRPKRVLRVKHPFDHFIQYEYVPSTADWKSCIQFVTSGVLSLPPGIVKVSLESVVVGFVYEGGFFCFNDPVIEEFPTSEAYSNVQHLLSPFKFLHVLESHVQVLETFGFDVDETGKQYVLHRVQVKNVPYVAWCVCEVREDQRDDDVNHEAYPKPTYLSPLVSEWTSFFKRHYRDNMRNKTFVRTKNLRLALTLSRHNVCFKIKIDEPMIVGETNRKESIVHDGEWQLILSEEETAFVNAARLVWPKETEKDERCCVM